MMTKKLLLIAPCKKNIGGVATIVAYLDKDLASNGVDVCHVCANTTIHRLIRPILSIHTLVLILISIIRFRPTHSLTFVSAGASYWEKLLLSYFVSLFNVKPNMVMVDGNFPCFYSNMSILSLRLSRALIKHVTLGAQSLKWSQYYSDIFKDTPIKVVMGGVDTVRFRPISSEITKPVSLLYVGWMIQKKGIYDLFDAVALLANDTNIRFTLTMVGPFHEGKEMVESYIEKKGIKNIVKLEGPIHNQNALVKLYQHSDIYVFPSHFEGYPVSLIEAISSGLACIATDVGGNSDILNNGECGIVVQKCNPIALKDAIHELILHDDKLVSLKLSARKRALEYHTIDQCVKSYVDLLN